MDIIYIIYGMGSDGMAWDGMGYTSIRCIRCCRGGPSNQLPKVGGTKTMWIHGHKVNVQMSKFASPVGIKFHITLKKWKKNRMKRKSRIFFTYICDVYVIFVRARDFFVGLTGAAGCLQLKGKWMPSFSVTIHTLRFSLFIPRRCIIR